MSTPNSIRLNGAPAEDICLACGLCCNGTIFADVRLQPGDNAGRLLATGLPLKCSPRSKKNSPPPGIRQFKFAQPCSAFDGCHCRLYEHRPEHCRHFECSVLKKLKTGAIPRRTALRLIRAARAKAELVRHLLRELGDTREELPLAKRFRRTSRRLEQIGLERPVAGVYADLTLAAHDLNYLLSQEFCPEL